MSDVMILGEAELKVLARHVLSLMGISKGCCIIMMPLQL